MQNAVEEKIVFKQVKQLVDDNVGKSFSLIPSAMQQRTLDALSLLVNYKKEEGATQKKEEEKQKEMFRQLPEEMKAAARFEVMHEFHLMQRLTEDCQGHPWAVRPNARTRSHDLSDHEQMRLKMEEEASRRAGVLWQERGPRQDESYRVTGKPSTANWRGQSWRTGSYGGKERYAKRGGRTQEKYARLNEQSRFVEANEAWSRQNEDAGRLVKTPPGAW